MQAATLLLVSSARLNSCLKFVYCSSSNMLVVAGAVTGRDQSSRFGYFYSGAHAQPQG